MNDRLDLHLLDLFRIGRLVGRDQFIEFAPDYPA